MSARTVLAALCGVAIALTVAAGVAVQAASNLNSSKSNLYRPAATDADRAACRAVGASLVVQDEKQVCINPKPPKGWAERQLPSCEACNRGCPGVCFMHVEGGCICFFDPLRAGG